MQEALSLDGFLSDAQEPQWPCNAPVALGICSSKIPGTSNHKCWASQRYGVQTTPGLPWVLSLVMLSETASVSSLRAGKLEGCDGGRFLSQTTPPCTLLTRRLRLPHAHSASCLGLPVSSLRYTGVVARFTVADHSLPALSVLELQRLRAGRRASQRPPLRNGRP